MLKPAPWFYYITDRTQFPGDEVARRKSLLTKIAEATRSGVDYIQLREKDLSARALESLARQALQVIQKNSGSLGSPRLLLNSRSDVALAVGADGVHLRSLDLAPAEVRRFCRALASPPAREFLIGVSCHTPAEIADAEDGADFVVFGPVFEKRATPQQAAPFHNAPETVALTTGLAQLGLVCAGHVPVLALGGITLENASDCLAQGARGVAGIRLFQQNDVQKVVAALRTNLPK